jgi:glycosyltransferase involved in cell wall biosynthesis
MGVDPSPARARDRARSVLFLGRLVPIKGVRVLLDAMSLLDHPARLVVAGDGPERASLEAAARARRLDAEFIGFVDAERRAALLAGAGVVVVPSIDLPGGRTEGTPVVALEALAAGAPLVASDVGGLAETVGGAAVLVPPGDPGALAGALARVLSRPGAAPVASRAFTWSEIGPRLLAGWLCHTEPVGYGHHGPR